MPDTVRTLVMPDLGEGLSDAVIAARLVGPGDHVQMLQPVLEVETDKATMEVTSPWSGEVIEVLVGEGDQVEVGGALLRIRQA